MKKIILLFTLLLPCFVSAEEYLGADLSGWPQNDSRKVVADFGAWLLVTPDLDWQQKWDTPPDTIPYFNEANEVSLGDKLVILTFYTNPGIDADGASHVKCTLRAERPDGTESVPEQSFDCFNGELLGNPRNVRLSPAVVQFTAEEGDPLGVWAIYVTLEDINKKALIELKTTYTYIGENVTNQKPVSLD